MEELEEKIRTIISDNSEPKNFCEYGEGIFATHDAVDAIVEEILELFKD